MRRRTGTVHTHPRIWRPPSQGKVNAKAMFNEVDVDKDGGLTIKEWDEFWANVKASGYSDEEIMEEVEVIAKGEAWVDFDDGRNT